MLAIGSCIGKRVPDRVPERAFPVAMEAMLPARGAQLLHS